MKIYLHFYHFRGYEYGAGCSELSRASATINIYFGTFQLQELKGFSYICFTTTTKSPEYPLKAYADNLVPHMIRGVLINTIFISSNRVLVSLVNIWSLMYCPSSTSVVRHQYHTMMYVCQTEFDLTNLPMDKMAAISQTIFSDAFSWMKSFVFWLKFHWSLFPSVQLTLTQHWFR